jgi:hypothetical protein
LGYLTAHADCDPAKFGMLSYVTALADTACGYRLALYAIITWFTRNNNNNNNNKQQQQQQPTGAT